MGKLIKIEELKPDMVIDKDVANLQGAVLLRKGNVVTEKHIKIFRAWGVKSIFVQTNDEAEDLGGRDLQEVVDEKIKELNVILDEKFALVQSNELMNTIKGLALKHRAAKIREKYKVKNGAQ
jgi:hypothetical protein